MTSPVSLPIHGRTWSRPAALMAAFVLAAVVAAVAVALTLLVARPAEPAVPAAPVHLTVASDGCPGTHPGQPC